MLAHNETVYSTRKQEADGCTTNILVFRNKYSVCARSTIQWCLASRQHPSYKTMTVALNRRLVEFLFDWEAVTYSTLWLSRWWLLVFQMLRIKAFLQMQICSSVRFQVQTYFISSSTSRKVYEGYSLDPLQAEGRLAAREIRSRVRSWNCTSQSWVTSLGILFKFYVQQKNTFDSTRLRWKNVIIYMLYILR